MEDNKYLLIGQKTVHDGKTLYAPGFYEDDINCGDFFKDAKAFHEDRNAVCYIPDSFFADELAAAYVDGVAFFDVGVYGYTRAQLERLVDGKVDEEGVPIKVEDFFGELLWQCPEVKLEEWTY